MSFLFLVSILDCIECMDPQILIVLYYKISNDFVFMKSMQMDSPDWEAATLILRRSGFQVKVNSTETLPISENFSKRLSVCFCFSCRLQKYFFSCILFLNDLKLEICLSHSCCSIQSYLFLGLKIFMDWIDYVKPWSSLEDKIYLPILRYIFSNLLIVQIKIPSGLSTQFVLTWSDGSSYPFNAHNDVGWETTFIYKSVARLVLTNGVFCSSLLDVIMDQTPNLCHHLFF